MKKFIILFLFSLTLESYASEHRFKNVYIDEKNNIHIISTNGKEKKLTNDGRASGAKLSPDKKTIVWLVLNSWIAEGDVIEGGNKLAIYRDGKLRHIKCEPFIRDYWFWMKGREVAIDCGGRHFAGTLILYDAASLRKIDSLFQADVPEEKRPEWSKSEGHAESDAAQ